MTVATSIDKYGEILSESMERTAPTAVLLSSETVHRPTGAVVQATVEVPSMGDWPLRYAILECATELESQFGVDVVCLFREPGV